MQHSIKQQQPTTPTTTPTTIPTTAAPTRVSQPPTSPCHPTAPSPPPLQGPVGLRPLQPCQLSATPCRRWLHQPTVFSRTTKAATPTTIWLSTTTWPELLGWRRLPTRPPTPRQPPPRQPRPRPRRSTSRISSQVRKIIEGLFKCSPFPML